MDTACKNKAGTAGGSVYARQRAYRNGKGPLKRPTGLLFLLFPCFFPAALTRQRFFYTLFFAGLQIKGVPFDLLDNVFLLHLPLKAAKCIFEGFSLLQPDFGQEPHPQTSPDRTC
jgi:hypothetical protein